MNSHQEPTGDEVRPQSPSNDLSAQNSNPVTGDDGPHAAGPEPSGTGSWQAPSGAWRTPGDAGQHPSGPGHAPSGPGQPPADGGPGAPGAPQPGPAQPNPAELTAAQRFFSWLRGLGVPRGSDRWIGGVASGIAHRIGIDPVIVRGLFLLFVIFGGIGILLYGLAWAFLPEPDGRIHAEGASQGVWSDGMTGALIVTILGLFRPFGGFWSGAWDFGSVLWTILWVGGLIAVAVWLFGSRNRNKQAPSTWQQPAYGTAQQPAYGSAAGADFTADTADGRASPSYAGTAGPASAGSANAARADATPPPLYTQYPSTAYPYTAEQPYRYQPETYMPVDKPAKEPARGPGAAMVAICAGLAMLVGGGLLGLQYVNAIDLGPSANALAAAAAAVVLGVGIIIAGLRGRTSGTLGFLAIIALLLGGVLGLIPSSGNFVVGSNTTWNPANAAAAESGYTAVMAQGHLELEGLEAQAPLSEEIVVPVQVAMGDMTVVVPEDVPVEVRSSLVFGSLNFAGDGTESSGIWNPSDQTLNADAPGEKIIVEVRGLFSQVTIAESGTESGSGQ